MQLFDEVVGGGCLGAGVLEPVVVVVELNVFPCLLDSLLSELESEEEIFGADCVVPLDNVNSNAVKETWERSLLTMLEEKLPSDAKASFTTSHE